MPSIDEITQQLRTAAASDPSALGGKTCKFDLKPDGVIRIDGATVDNQDTPADCTISVAKEDFEKMAAGTLDPTMAFMQGKLKVAGDMSIAMKLGPMLAKARG